MCASLYHSMQGEGMQENQIHRLLQDLIQITDEDWHALKNNSPGVYRFFERMDQVGKYRIIAEVIESKYCAAGLKKGQQFVIEGGALVPEKSTAPFCMRALAPLTGFINTILEKIVAGEDPNDRVFRVAECLDPGLGAGGLGKVRFLVKADPL